MTMMIKRGAALFFTLLCFLQVVISQTEYTDFNRKPLTDRSRIVIEAPIISGASIDSVGFSYKLIEKVPGFRETRTVNLKVNDQTVKWAAFVDKPCMIYTGRFLSKENLFWLTEPGDSIRISYKGKSLVFLGSGAEKFQLQNRVKEIKDSLKATLSNTYKSFTNNVEDYLEWNRYLNDQLRIIIPLIDSYKQAVSPFFYQYFKDYFLDEILDNRTDKFYTLLGYGIKSGMLEQSICAIYDSTYTANTTPDKIPSLSRQFLGSWGPIKLQLARKYAFKFEDEHVNSELKRHLLYYEIGKKMYSGYVLEKFKEEFLTTKLIKEFGFIPEVNAALELYYAEADFPEHKQYVKEYEKMSRQLVAGSLAPQWILTDMKGRSVSSESLKNKVILVDFWFTGCVGCVQLTPVLQHIEEQFKKDSNLVFVSVSVDENKLKWLNSIKQGKYTTGKGINLITNGLGENHPLIKNYVISAYPTIFLIDERGRVVQNPLPDPRKDNGSLLINLIGKKLSELKDGPYLLYENNKSVSFTINNQSAIKKEVTGNNLELPIQTDEYLKVFNARKKNSLLAEPSEFEKPARLLALSDIEGNFDALRKLLVANKVIDEDFNWIFKTGHLVFCGDMFDRGNQVTECLWLLYSLEEKAKAAGGYVHFILGNHEIMNLSGDDRYVVDKYKRNAEKMGKSYNELYGLQSELGRWLRTKNIMEIIGDLLFVHGGISQEINRLPLSISQINDKARPWLDKETEARKSTDKALAILFDSHDQNSPFWFRGYYLDQDMKVMLGGSKGIDTIYKTKQEVVDASLVKFGVKGIVTGHTIVQNNGKITDTVSTHFMGKVFNTDTRHAQGMSEALLIENDNYYRVNSEGEKIKLMSPNKNIPSSGN
jgi:thiol-disulfide isomerase/thioredoxin